MKKPVLFALITLMLAATSFGETTILVPTLYRGPGAFGSTWWSSVFIANHSALPFSSPGVELLVNCPIPEGCPSADVPPGEYGLIIEPRPAGGLLLYAPDEIAADLAFQARFGQASNVGTNGTELPLVRDDELTRSAIRLPGVSLHNTLFPIRTTLRVYGVDAIPGTTVRIDLRHWFLPTGDVLASKVIGLHVPASPAGASRPIYPAYAQLNMQHEFPYEALLGSSFHVTIVPLPAASGEVPRIWAFLSTTNNTSQEVTIQQPQ